MESGRDGHTGVEDVVLKKVMAIRVAELTATAPTYDRREIEQVIGPLYCELFRRLDAVGVQAADAPPIAYYDDPAEPGDAIIVHAAVPLPAVLLPNRDFAVVELPVIRRAATIIHRGVMEDVIRSLWLLAGWIEDNGYSAVGYHREVYLSRHPIQDGKLLAELQVGVTRSSCAGGDLRSVGAPPGAPSRLPN
jgi:effector-binding domain-containing protein